MKNKLWQGWQFLCFLLRCIPFGKSHSSFANELIVNLFKEKSKFYAFDEIESIRAKLLLTPKEITIKDLGAGSSVHKSNTRTINNIAKTSLKPVQKAQLLYRFVSHFKPKNTFELGTCLGITTAYLAAGNPKGKVITLEGSPELAKVAKVNFDKLEIENISQVVGNFDDTFSTVLKKYKTADFIFFDGNHQEAATLRYFEQALPYSTENSIFIFDDIYWSPGMTNAWNKIKNHPRVTLTLDCFEMGFVFFRKTAKKEQLTVYH